MAVPAPGPHGSGVLSAKQGAPVAARGGGPVIMEHLLLEVAAAPLRLIAAKNEKSRSELGRFLVKQVREGTGGKELGRPLTAWRVPHGPARRRRGPEIRVLSLWPPPQGWPVAEASARI